MAIKCTLIISLFLSALLGCIPTLDEADCFSPLNEGEVFQPNLASISPMNAIYNKNDTLTLNLVIPSENSYFGRSLDLFDQTNQTNVLIGGLNISGLISGNGVDIKRGSHSVLGNTTVANLLYYPATNTYEYIVEIILNQSGQYSIYGQEYQMAFVVDDRCSYRLNTSLQGLESNPFFEFEVIDE